ncbi:MAG: hypothetical protein KKH75_05690 [Actinobacteria bacterium]|nr:hypothetical protein [Actinomycetota bacterium]
MTDEQLNQTSDPTGVDEIHTDASTDDTTAADTRPPQYGVGPFSIREVALAGVWLVAFVVSFFPVSGLRDSVWTSGLLWILTIAVPTVAVFLIVLRRLSPLGIRGVGSLGIDQFASVAFSVSAALWLQFVWETVAFAAVNGIWVRTWVMWVEFVLMLAGVVLTVLAPHLPVLGEDFRDRPEAIAHRSARPVRPVVPRPAPAVEHTPAADHSQAGEHAPAASGLYQPQQTYDTAEFAYRDDYTPADSGAQGSVAAQSPSDEWAPAQTRESYEPLTTGDAAPSVEHQAFWALAPVERDVVDETGAPLFRVGPTAWALVIEDRGAVYIIRHEDGRVGYLHDVSGVTRG